MSRLKAAFQLLKETTLKSAIKELAAIIERDNITQKSVFNNLEEARLKGKLLSNLILDQKYLRHCPNTSDVEIRFHHNHPVASTARSFRKGKQ